MRKNILIFAFSGLLAACATSPTQPSTRVIGSSSTSYTHFYRIGCIDHMPREEAVKYRTHVEITKYEDRSIVCVRYEGNEERCEEASVPRNGYGAVEIYTTAEGDTMTLDVGSFTVTGGKGCYTLGRYD